MEKTGTKVTFLPDDTIFTETTVYDFDVLKRRLREMAFLTKGLRIILRDNRTEEETSLEGGSVVDSAAAEAMSTEHEKKQSVNCYRGHRKMPWKQEHPQKQ